MQNRVRNLGSKFTNLITEYNEVKISFYFRSTNSHTLPYLDTVAVFIPVL